MADRVGNVLVTPHIILDRLAEDPRATEALAMLPQANQGLRQAMGYLAIIREVRHAHRR